MKINNLTHLCVTLFVGVGIIMIEQNLNSGDRVIGFFSLLFGIFLAGYFDSRKEKK